MNFSGCSIFFECKFSFLHSSGFLPRVNGRSSPGQPNSKIYLSYGVYRMQTRTLEMSEFINISLSFKTKKQNHYFSKSCYENVVKQETRGSLLNTFSKGIIGEKKNSYPRRI